eukprot:1186747-Prorocentrum_minimum.AAC.2
MLRAQTFWTAPTSGTVRRSPDRPMTWLARCATGGGPDRWRTRQVASASANHGRVNKRASQKVSESESERVRK